ncbi:MAG TPA: hypothetical protein VF540_01205 [Segetibacter sp.]
MKKFLLSVFLCVFAGAAFSQTADEVINKFMEASGGKEKLKAINTLQYTQTINMKTPMGDFAMPMQFYREKNKLFRMQASMQIGPQSLDFFTVVTDTAGYIKLPELPMLGSNGGTKKMEEKDRAAQTFQSDPAGLFAGLVDYGSKGSKVELLPHEKVNSEDCYQVKYTSKAGDEVIYFISKATNLVVRADTKGGMAANLSGFSSLMGGAEGQAQKVDVSAFFSDYEEVKGVKLPLKSVIKNQMGDAESAITNIKINEPIEAKWYKAE